MNSGGELGWHVGVYQRYEKREGREECVGSTLKGTGGGIRQSVVK